MKVTDNEKENLLETITNKYGNLIVKPGEAVEIVTAHSLGGPGTQLTLRT